VLTTGVIKLSRLDILHLAAIIVYGNGTEHQGLKGEAVISVSSMLVTQMRRLTQKNVYHKLQEVCFPENGKEDGVSCSRPTSQPDSKWARNEVDPTASGQQYHELRRNAGFQRGEGCIARK
jgi:hypothetical protein